MKARSLLFPLLALICLSLNAQVPQNNAKQMVQPAIAQGQSRSVPAMSDAPRPSISSQSKPVPEPSRIEQPQPGRDWDLQLGGDEVLKLKWIAPGSFQMGSNDGDNDEKPVHRVTLSQGYWLGTIEVTQGQWQAVMGSNPSSFKGSILPVEQVSWDDAQTFCQKLTESERAAGRLPAGMAYALPTEAQWEYACRASTTGAYAGELNAMAWYGKNSGGETHAVGTQRANAWGLYDMHGNVWEWCSDWYGTYPSGSVVDPSGASSGSKRVRRGGCWYNSTRYCRSAVRYRHFPGFRSSSIGFRLALTPSLRD